MTLTTVDVGPVDTTFTTANPVQVRQPYTIAGKLEAADGSPTDCCPPTGP